MVEEIMVEQVIESYETIPFDSSYKPLSLYEVSTVQFGESIYYFKRCYIGNDDAESVMILFKYNIHSKQETALD